MNTSERIVDLLGNLLTRRERAHAPARPARVLGRHQDGTERLLRLDATCITRASRDNHYTGTTILSLASSAGRQGTTGQGTAEVLASPTLWIESLDPSTYHPGQQITVKVTGRGFDQSTRIDFLDPDPQAPEGTINPDLEVLAVLAVSSELLLLELSVSSSARPLTSAPIAYGRAQ